jgi:hypothetical protein
MLYKVKVRIDLMYYFKYFILFYLINTFIFSKIDFICIKTEIGRSIIFLIYFSYKISLKPYKISYFYPKIFKTIHFNFKNTFRFFNNIQTLIYIAKTC